jgi:hypothetical protein
VKLGKFRRKIRLKMEKLAAKNPKQGGQEEWEGYVE